MPRRPLLAVLAFSAGIVGLFVAILVAGYRPNLGLDLQGGVSVVLQPTVDGEDATDIPSESLDQTKQIIEQRVNAIGVGEPDVTVQGDTIVVQLPGIEDQQRALELVGQTAELRFRPVLQNLAPAPTAADEERILELRAELGIPEGTTALDVYNSEQAARGLPTLPDPTAPATEGEAPPVEAPTTTLAGEGTGGGRSPKVRRAPAQTETTEAPAPGVPAAPTTTVPVTTTTIDPAPVNEFGIEVYTDPQGTVSPELQELLQLEQAAAQSDLETTSAADDDPTATVILEGTPTEVDGQEIVPRYELGPVPGSETDEPDDDLTGRAIEDASAGLGGQGGTEWVVRPVFKPGAEGIDLFNQTAQACNTRAPECPTGQLAIVLDSVVLSAPSINEPQFARDQIEISGSFDQDSANDLATALRFGSLPLVLEPQQVQTVSATLGEGALEAGLIAGAVGLALVVLYVIAYYRLLGLVTFGALVLSGMALWVVVGFFGENQGLTLTLAGIVGIVVSIGVSLDSSIVFYESLKEDVRNGRSLRSATEGSFRHAYSTILKADFSSLIGAAILYWLSIGPVRGFAFYLGLSTILDLTMAYFFTRPTVGLLTRSSLGTRPALFGIPPVEDEPQGPVEGGPPPVAATVGGGEEP